MQIKLFGKTFGHKKYKAVAPFCSKMWLSFPLAVVAVAAYVLLMHAGTSIFLGIVSLLVTMGWFCSKN